MNFNFKKEEKELIEEVRKFISQEATPEMMAETYELGGVYGGSEGRKFIQKFAAKGWLTPDWPKRFGGLGASHTVTYMVLDELTYAGAPKSFVGVHYAGPTILRFGSEEMKEKFLPPLARGEIEFSLGYTEPEAGSDLMSLSMLAEDKGDFFLVNGKKIFNTHAHVADYHWLAVRTEPRAPKHRGISLLIVDLKTPGITINPMITMVGPRTNEVVYDDVVVPKTNLLGEKNMGYKYLMVALDFERMFPFGQYRRLFEDIVEYTKRTVIGGKPMCKNPIIRQKLAQMAIELQVAHLLYSNSRRSEKKI
jgi:hypothetical protein